MPSEHSSVSPPALSSGASASQRRETLTSRAKRIIGRVLDVGEEISTPPESSVKGQKGKKPSTRRREQVLQAQRTHRQRTQGYIRELEKEVLRLRDSEERLKSENACLKTALSENGIAVPDMPSPTSIPGSLSPERLQFPDPVSSTVDTSSAASVTIDLTELSTIEPEVWCSVAGAMEETPPFESPTISVAQLLDDTSTRMPETLREGSVGNYGSAPALSPQAAVDFVLELERPCLGHVKHAHLQQLSFAPLGGRSVPDFNHGPHHVFTTAAGLITSGFSNDPIHETFQMPTSSLERLFQTSLSLNLGDDVTPVQIWANIRRIAMNFSVDITMLQVLKNEFMKYVRCNSFGTVVHRDVVSSVFSFYFPGEQFIPVWS